MKIVISVIYMLVSLTVFAEADKNSDEVKKWDVNNPPGEAVLIDIKTDNGTWMNLDVSSDGKTIAFDMLGDIYTLPISGGKAKNITNSMAWEMQPRFSPDGKQLAVTSDQGGGDNIWIMDLQGENRLQVSKEKFRLLNAPAWSPDGQFIVARKHFTGMRSIGAGEIWMYHKSGGDGVQLNKRPNEQKDLGEPVFSADGKYVLFSRDSTPGKYFEYSKDSNNQIYEIYAIELATGEIKSWVSGQGGAVRPTPSPDGKSLAFVRRIRNNSSLFIQDRESGKLDVLYKGLERDMQETWAIHGVYPTFAWMPDGKDIVFWAKGKIHSIDVDSKKVTNIAFEVDDQREIRQAVSVKNKVASDQFDAKMLRWLSPSADGSMAVFQALGYIYTVKLPDGKPKRLTKQNDHFELYPKFTSDGKKIVYTTWDDEKLGSVRIAKLNGSSKELTSKPGHYVDPSVSADGKSLVFEAISAGYLTSPLYTQETGLFISDVKSGKTSKLSSNGGNAFFTDDSGRVFYTDSKTTGEVTSTQLKSVDLSGNNERSHYQGPWISSYQVSPDNKWLAFIQNFQVYVTPFIQNGQYIATGSKAANLPLKKFSEFAGNNLNWSSASESLNWSLGSVLYSQKLDEKFAFLKQGEPADQEEIKAEEVNIQLLVKTDKPTGLIALTGAKIITIENVNGQQQVIEDGTIIIKDNQIQAVGNTNQVSIPATAEVFDLKGKTIIPGMIDVHWHGPYANRQIIPQTSWNAYANLAFGITTTHNPSANTQAVFAASEMQKAGIITAPRIYSTGTILYGATHFFTAPVNNLEDAVGHLERMKAVGAFSVKSYNQPRRNQRQQVIEAARQTGLMVVPEGGSLFMHNMTMIIDGHTGIEHSIPVANIYDDVVQLWSGSDTAYVPTLTVGYGGIWGEKYWYDTTEVWKHPLLSKYVPREILEAVSVRRTKAPIEDYNHFNNAKVAKKLQAAGVDVLLGAHGQREGLGSHWEMWMFVQGGMSELEALRAVTIDSARYIGMEDELGSIKAGKLADLVILDADPLDNIQNSDQVHMVMLNGKLYDAASMDQIAPIKSDRAQFYFE